MNSQALIGVDIGGTKISIGKVLNGKIVEELKFPTLPERPEKQIIDDIINGIDQIFDPQVVGIGIGVPGLVDTKKGIIYNLSNIPSWKEVHIKDHIESYFKIPVQIANDANCFVLGEKIYGKGQQFSNLVGITLGTGLGTGIIINNGLHAGVLSIAGEIAEIPYLSNNFEHFCSNKFFINFHNTSAFEVFEKAMSGDTGALQIFDEFGDHLGNLTQNLILIYGPEAIIFGGSLSKAFDLFYPSLMQNLTQFPYQNVVERIKVLDFTSEKTPLLGAASLSLLSLNDNYLSEILTYEKK